MTKHKVSEKAKIELAAGQITDPHQRLILELVDALGEADQDTILRLCIGLEEATGSVQRAVDGVLALKKKGTLQPLLRDYIAQND